MIGAMFSGRHALQKNDVGAYFIDRDGMHFRHILNFLRAPENFVMNLEANLEKELKCEADFYGLGDVMFSFSPAEPHEVQSTYGNILTITQDAHRIWYMACPQIGMPLEAVTFCWSCKVGSCCSKKYTQYSIVKNFSTMREIIPSQFRYSTRKPCPSCHSII
jgi:hypothetical protein